MLSEGSPNVNRPACGKKIRKINKQFLYHRDPMWYQDKNASFRTNFEELGLKFELVKLKLVELGLICLSYTNI